MRAAFLLFCLVAGAAPMVQGQELAREVHLASDSLDPDLAYQRAMDALQKHKWTVADSLLRRAIQIDPHHALAYYALGALPYQREPRLREKVMKNKVPDNRRDAVAEASRFARMAMLLDPVGALQSERELFPLALYGRNLSEKDKARLPAGFFYARAESFIRYQEYEPAVADLEEVMARWSSAGDSLPTNTVIPLALNEVRYLVAVLEARLGRTADAQSLFEQVLTQDLGMYMAHVQLAAIHEENGAWNAAVRERARAVEADPADPALKFELGRALARAAQLAEADTVLAQAVEQNPHNAAYVYAVAQVRQALGDTARAVQGYRHFLAIAPSILGPDIRRAHTALAELGGSAAH
ncbi:MAG TPA: tetratricopeptide repeat protein [Gemmatimonadales bacterium]|nr:tetratricopeptide repeat protein [Gemmatimonadales bacterium]